MLVQIRLCWKKPVEAMPKAWFLLLYYRFLVGTGTGTGNGDDRTEQGSVDCP